MYLEAVEDCTRKSMVKAADEVKAVPLYCQLAIGHSVADLAIWQCKYVSAYYASL